MLANIEYNAQYIRISRMARKIYERYTDQVEPFGLDENWLDVTGSVGLFGSPMAIAQEISERIKFELGITASIGVSFNKIFAKLGSDYKKPDAITRIGEDNYKQIVFPLPVEDLLYVGPATSRKLRSACIDTIGKLAACDEEFLERRLGKMGLILSSFANGRDPSPVLKSDHIGCTCGTAPARMPPSVCGVSEGAGSSPRQPLKRALRPRQRSTQG